MLCLDVLGNAVQGLVQIKASNHGDELFIDQDKVDTFLSTYNKKSNSKSVVYFFWIFISMLSHIFKLNFISLDYIFYRKIPLPQLGFVASSNYVAKTNNFPKVVSFLLPHM